jgi:hypothetical protein
MPKAGCHRLRGEFRAAESPRRAVRDDEIISRRPRDGAVEHLERLLVGLVDFLDRVAPRNLQADVPLFAVGGFEVGANRALLLAETDPAVGITDQLCQGRAPGQHQADGSHQCALADAVVAEQQRPLPRDAGMRFQRQGQRSDAADVRQLNAGQKHGCLLFLNAQSTQSEQLNRVHRPELAIQFVA